MYWNPDAIKMPLDYIIIIILKRTEVCMYILPTYPINFGHHLFPFFNHRVHFSEEVSENRPVKFIYQGRVLNDELASLQSLNINDGCPVHVHVGRPRETPQQRAENEQQHANEFLDLSRLFVPLFGVILGIAWVGLFCYPDVFTLVTKLFLFFLSVGYILLAYSSVV